MASLAIAIAASRDGAVGGPRHNRQQPRGARSGEPRDTVTRSRDRSASPDGKPSEWLRQLESRFEAMPLCSFPHREVASHAAQGVVPGAPTERSCLDPGPSFGLGVDVMAFTLQTGAASESQRTIYGAGLDDPAPGHGSGLEAVRRQLGRLTSRRTQGRWRRAACRRRSARRSMTRRPGSRPSCRPVSERQSLAPDRPLVRWVAAASPGSECPARSPTSDAA
jgi:hypothetical protein